MGAGLAATELPRRLALLARLALLVSLEKLVDANDTKRSPLSLHICTINILCTIRIFAVLCVPCADMESGGKEMEEGRANK